MNERRWKCTALYCSVTFPSQHCLACRHRARDWAAEVANLEAELKRAMDALEYKNICEVVEAALRSYRCAHHVDVDDSSLPLADILTPEGDISIEAGLEEITYMAECVAEEFVARKALGKGRCDGR